MEFREILQNKYDHILIKNAYQNSVNEKSGHVQNIGDLSIKGHSDRFDFIPVHKS